MPGLDAGGGEKSLVSLLNSIDWQLYQADLILFNPSGIFLKLLPPQINVIVLENDYATFTQPLHKSVLAFVKKGKWGLAYHRLAFTLKQRSHKNNAIAEQQSWKNLRKAIPEICQRYDAAIAFLEKTSVYFVVDCISATRKIGFIHNEYKALGLNAAFDLPYFEKLDVVATVSAQCQNVLQQVFPDQQHKVKVMHNIVSASLIEKMANAPIHINTSKPVLLSIGRLHPQKGFDLAVEAAAILKQKNIDFIWYVIGEGAERKWLENRISDLELHQHFILLGLKENPYPYIKAAEIVVQSSRYEGKSIAIDEAKILAKPIIVTNFSTAKDQIVHNHNGIICEMDAENLALAIQNLLNDQALQAELSLHLRQEKQALSTENEIAAFYQMLNDER